MIFEYIEFPISISKMNEYGKKGWRYMFTYTAPGESEMFVVMGRRS